ncbi:MAG: biotin--[acetyl-CoA-carboxylase] ligase, partial [Candidatus Nitrosotenuis sp.]
LGITTELKWPNDLTLNGKKIAGMIIDASIESTRIESLVLGVGINFRVDPAQIEKKIRHNPNFYGVATLVDKNYGAKPAKLVQSFLEELERALALFASDKTQLIINQWMKKSSTIGRTVRVTTHGQIISGKAVKLDNDGALIIRQNSKSIRVTAGDVAY